jgi:hypothetical protein
MGLAPRVYKYLTNVAGGTGESSSKSIIPVENITKRIFFGADW